MRRLVIAALFFLSACGESENDRLKRENQELTERVDQLESQLADVKEKAETLKTASDELQSQLARFESENWRDVMPDAQEAGQEVESAQQDLSEATDE